MASCKDISAFLEQVALRQVTTPLPEADAQNLANLGLVRLVSADQYRDLSTELAGLAGSQAALQAEATDRSRLGEELRRDWQHTHSILFHLHGAKKEAEEIAEEERTRAAFQAVDTDFAKKQAAFNELLAKRSLFDTLAPYGAGYVGLTSAGTIALRDLKVRLYRLADSDFTSYLAQAGRIDQELGQLADGGAGYVQNLTPGLQEADRSYLWAISVGLTKVQPDLTQGVPRFLEAYRALSGLSANVENRLMASEIVFAIPQPIPTELLPLTQLVQDVRGIGVPKESALGVASIVLFGRRSDGSFATGNVARFLQETRSFESAALLGIVNVPADQLVARFHEYRALFAGWGFDYSEDSELSSAYLAVSEYAPNEVAAKLAILQRGLSRYLEYPLVAASILASVATLEANETLNLLEKAYGIVGRRATGFGQADLICIAVRMVHGIRNELVGTLDATAARPVTAAPGPPAPRLFFLPLVIAHNAYFSTFGGIGGVHPGHVHGIGGFGGGLG